MSIAPRAQARVDLANFAHNLGVLRAAAPGAQQMAVVKADGYGHGLIECARAAREVGAEWLGVALFAEALRLRADGDRQPVLAWLGSPGDPWNEVVDAGVDIGVSSIGGLDRVALAAAGTGRPAAVHLKIDTGLGRAGCTSGQWPELVRAALRWQSQGRLEVVGLWSHFTVADDPGDPLNLIQVQRFGEAVEVAQSLGVRDPLRHLANSAATLALPAAHFDLVRPGIAMYGISPGPGLGEPQALGLRPVMTLMATAMLAKRLPEGAGLSYGHTYHLEHDATTVVVPLGYADGIPRAASNRGPVTIAGRRLRVSGRVCMDQFVVDAGDLEVSEGDQVLLFGAGEAVAGAEDWARACDTIGYEIVTRIGPRVERTYSGGAT